MVNPEIVDIYAVGLFSDFKKFLGQRVAKKELGARYLTPYKTFFKSIKREFKHLWDGNWRAFKNYFNGYLAEHVNGNSNAGHGWTKKRAFESLFRIRKEMGLNLNDLL